MSPTIAVDRLTHRIRVLRVRWHAEGDVLLKAGKFVEFTDGLLRLMRQLDAIEAAVERLTDLSRFGTGFGTQMPTAVGSRAERPSRRPVGGII